MAFDPENTQANDKINDLERDLYSRNSPEIAVKQRPNLPLREKSVQYGWRESEKILANEVVEAEQTKKKHSFAAKLFLSAILFFAVAAGIAAFIILGGFNVISSKNVDVSVQGLVAAAAGEELSLDIIVKNNNNSTLDSGIIYIEYPEGTRSPVDSTKELLRDQLTFGEIPAGGSATKTVKTVLFGEKDSVKQIKIAVEYKASGSNAVFSKEKTFDITIKSSPILMTVDVPREVNAGQNIEIKIEVASNSNTLIRDLLVRAEYPFGFTFTDANPGPVFENNIWRIGDLDSKGKRTILLRGRIDGQNDEERTFRFMTGAADLQDERRIATGFVSIQQPLFIKKPFIGLVMQLNGRSGDYVISPGEKVQGTLVWSNNIPIAINDAIIQIKLSGKGLDRNQVSAVLGGFFRSIDNTIIWDKNSMPGLWNLEPGETGLASFTFAALPASQLLSAQARNVDIILSANMKGVRIQGGVPQEVNSIVNGTAKIGTNLAINGRILRDGEPFENTGPIPPRAERETTYTVVLGVSNSFNDANDVVLTTKLPPYVAWLGAVSPSTEQIAYDDSTRTISWNIPELRAGVGYTSFPKEVAFQLSFLPSLNQIGNAPNLTGELSVTGADRFTGAIIESNKPALTTRFNTDPSFRNGDDRVGE